MVYLAGCFWAILQVFKTQMEVATGAQDQAITELGLNSSRSCCTNSEHECEFGLGVGSCDDVGYAFGDGRFRHLERHFEEIQRRHLSPAKCGSECRSSV